MTDKAAGVYGICLRGKPGWGENRAFLTATANSLGARWFDEKWQPAVQLAGMESDARLLCAADEGHGPPGASSNGFNENLALFDGGKCGMWIDATVAAGLIGPARSNSKVAGKVGYALASTTVSASAATGCGHGRWAFRLARKMRTRRRSSSRGRPTNTTLILSLRRWARQRSAWDSHIALQERRLH